jgi:hypothetical protein
MVLVYQILAVCQILKAIPRSGTLPLCALAAIELVACQRLVVQLLNTSRIASFGAS